MKLKRTKAVPFLGHPVVTWHFIQDWFSTLVAVIVQPPAETHNYTGRRLPMTAFEQTILNETSGKLYVCNLVLLYITQPSIPPGSANEHQLRLGKKGSMVHSVSGCTRNVQVRLWNPLRTRAIPERLRGVITTRRYTNPHLPLPYLERVFFSVASFSTFDF